MRELEFHKLKIGKSKGLKLSEVKKKKRKKNSVDPGTVKEFKLTFGSVWGIQDSLVLFDNKRKDEHFKDSARPCLLIETPTNYRDYSPAVIAPGTTSYYQNDENNDKVLTAQVPPEDLNQTTYFKLFFRQYIFQKNLEKKFCDLSSALRRELDYMLNV
jgi:hypothetical protein